VRAFPRALLLFKGPSVAIRESRVDRVVGIPLIQPFRLLLDGQLRVTDNAKEEDILDLKSDFLLISLGMGLF
jgi:hypothetical protein